MPAFEDRVWDQISAARKAKPDADLASLLRRGDVWEIFAGGRIQDLG